MVNIDSGGGAGVPRSPAEKAAGSGNISEEKGVPFVLENSEIGATFAPTYFPETFRRVKEYDLERELGFCGGENVSNLGVKNYNIHVVGRALTEEVQYYDAVVEEGEPLLMTSLGWSGEAIVNSAELEGPVATDPQHDQYHWMYTIDLVSTGRDEVGEQPNDGIIDAGEAIEEFVTDDEQGISPFQ